MIIFDGNWIAQRQFHALSRPDNRDVLSISIISSFLKYLKVFGYDNKIVVAWDNGTYRYRNKSESPDYKKGRDYDESYQTCWDSIDWLHSILPSLGISSIKYPGVEADDIAYYISTLDIDKVFIASDRDWLACINENSRVHRPVGKVHKTYEIKDLLEEYELKSTEDWWFYKSLVGDSSDNIPSILSHKKAINYIYSEDKNLISEDKFKCLEDNYELIRMDHIMSDEEVISDIKTQLINSDINHNISDVLPKDYPQYFNSVLNKYFKDHNRLII
jgi:5'-3' exonuclease